MQICSKLEIFLTFSRKCLFYRIFTLLIFTLQILWQYGSELYLSNMYIYVLSYLDMKLRCKKQSQFLSLLLLLSHSLACLTSHFLLCATFHNFEQLGFCISSLHGELWQLEQGDKSCIKCPSLKWGITFGAESSKLVPLEQRRTQESKVTGSD